MARTFILTLLLLPSTLPGQVSRVSPADPIKDGVFGHAVDIDGSGTVMIIGSPGANLRKDFDDFSGTAYVFTRHGAQWSQLAKLVPAEIGSNDAFGSSVALSGDGSFALVGAPLTSGSGYATGAAYVFRCRADGCIEQARLTPTGGTPGDLFGISVAIDDSGLVAVVGASGHATFSGAVWVFQREGEAWMNGSRVVPETGQDDAAFGRSVSLSGDASVLWVGEPLHVGPAGRTGAVRVFGIHEGVWWERAILYPDSNVETRLFGYAVDLSVESDFGIVGAPGVGREGFSFGSVTLFSNPGAGWSRQTVFQAPDLKEAARFGASVGLDGPASFALVGSPGDARNGFHTGRAFLYAEWNGLWSLARELESDSARHGDRFGFAVGLDGAGDQAIVGVREGDFNEFDAGLALAFGPSTLPVSNRDPGRMPTAASSTSGGGLEAWLYPTPTRNLCRLRIFGRASGWMTIEAFDLSGRRIDTVFEGGSRGRTSELLWDTSSLPTGIYLVRIRSDDDQKTLPLIHTR